MFTRFIVVNKAKYINIKLSCISETMLYVDYLKKYQKQFQLKLLT